LRTRERATIDDVAQTTVELSIALAERLVGAEIAADRQRLDLIVRDALERMQPTRTLTVWGHADDLAVMERQLAEHGELAEYRSALTFRAVKSGVRGVLKIEADDWFVQWDTQRSLTELRDRLLEETFANE
jgi:flagellar biosynthesis/type III secretory pathway protein FliH